MKSDSYIYRQTKILNIRGQLMDISTPRVMGILNVTPDSFFEENRFTTETAILAQTEKMLIEGASIIDIGGYSSRPEAEDISIEEELSRTVNAVKLIAKRFPNAILSVDTFRSEVARQAFFEGASIINDISGGELDAKISFTRVCFGNTRRTSCWPHHRQCY